MYVDIVGFINKAKVDDVLRDWIEGEEDRKCEEGGG